MTLAFQSSWPPPSAGIVCGDPRIQFILELKTFRDSCLFTWSTCRDIGNKDGKWSHASVFYGWVRGDTREVCKGVISNAMEVLSDGGMDNVISGFLIMPTDIRRWTLLGSHGQQRSPTWTRHHQGICRLARETFAASSARTFGVGRCLTVRPWSRNACPSAVSQLPSNPPIF